MTKLIPSLLLSGLLSALLLPSLPLAAAPSPADGALGPRLSTAIMQRYTPTIDAMAHNGWDHTNSAVLHGMEKVYRRSHDKAVLDYIKAYADQFINNDGSINGLHANLDGMHPGVVCLFLYQETGDKKYLAAARTMVDMFIGTADHPSTFRRTPEGGYWHKSEEHYKNVMTIDGLYMVYPFLVRYAVLSGDRSLLDLAAAQILMTAEHTFSVHANLAYHGWDYGKEQTWSHPITGSSTQFWSRSVGWLSMTLVDVLEALPRDHPQYGKLLLLFQSLAKGIQATQNPQDGMWYDMLTAPPGKGNFPETSGSGMVVYALQKGVNLALLDNAYHAVAQRGWQGLQKTVSVYKDGGPQINSVAPGQGIQNDYAGYVAIRPVSVPSEGGRQQSHGYIALLMAASVMEQAAP
jgi:unsaturated rhamnogalacturonyl hydrolase